MTKRHATVAGLGSLMALLGIAGLLAGFVPDRAGSSLSRPVSSHVAQLQPDDLPELHPDSAISYSARVLPPDTLTDPSTADMAANLADNTLTSALVAFDGPTAENGLPFVGLTEEGVHFQTTDGPILLSRPQPLLSCAWSPISAEGDSPPLVAQENVNVLTKLIASCVRPAFSERFFLVPPTVEEQIALPFFDQQESYVARARRYEQSITRMAGKYSLDVDLVKALIHTESGFNPRLISPRSALGLMQVVPSSAGGEVHRFLHGQAGLPDMNTLLDPDTNITYGTSYLHLLLTRHFGAVRDPKAREYCAIAAYNGGPNAVLRLFGAERGAALEGINSLSSEQLFTRLRADLPALETRNFLIKVLALRQQYAQIKVAELE